MAKKVSKKVQKVTHENLKTAAIITSVLINVFFLLTSVLVKSTNYFDYSLYEAARQHYCVNHYKENLEDAVVTEAEAGYSDAGDLSVQTLASFNVQCQSEDFMPYLDEAYKEYVKDLSP